MLEQTPRWITVSLAIALLLLGSAIFIHIATRWWSLSHSTQLITSYLLLSLTAAAIYQSWQQQQSYLMELCILVFMTLCFSTVILLSTTYQLNEATHDMFFVGCLLTLPIVFVSKKFVAPLLWSVIFLVAITLKAAVAFVAVNIVDVKSALVGMIMALPLLAAMLMFSNQFYFQRDHFRRAFELCLLTTGLFAIVIADQSLLARELSFNFIAIIPSVVFALLCAVGLTRLSPLMWRHRMLLNAILVTYLLLFTAASFSTDISDIGALFTIALLMLTAIHFAGLGRMMFFNFFLMLIALRILLTYYTEFPDVAHSYVGLSLSAIMMMIIVFLWLKNRKAIEKFASGFLINE